jgi:hypothetical protein
MLFYRAALPLLRQTLTFVSALIRIHRRELGSVWRKLNPGQEALLVEQVDDEGGAVRIWVRSRNGESACPDCAACRQRCIAAMCGSRLTCPWAGVRCRFCSSRT